MSLGVDDLDFLKVVVAEHSGNVLSERHSNLLEQKLVPLAVESGLSSVEQLIHILRQDSDKQLRRNVAEAVTVNETSFFRDMNLFESLRTTILPDVIAQKEHTKELRIWCAACSSGQEPYSIAMLIREEFAQLNNWNVQIVATDLSETMLERSRVGEYTQMEINRGLPAKKLLRFFDRKGPLWRVTANLRNMVEHRRLNLTKPWPFLGQFDLIFIRNVLIYFDQPTKLGILKRARRILNPNGYLFIGSAETVIGMGVPFQRQEINGTVSYRPSDD